MYKALILIALIVLLCHPALAESRQIRILGPQSEEDVSQDYFYDLLAAALNKSNTQAYELDKIDGDSLTQGRSLKLLASDQIDVFWMGTSKERELNYQAIKIPLLKGLLGYRVSIIKRSDLPEFRQMSLDQLQKKLACQGEHWPDTKILKFNRFSVVPVARYEFMFDMVSKGRCDYFPRAIFEGYGELQAAQKRLTNLAMFDDIIFHYPFPIYFFVKQQDKELKRAIKLGLETMIDSGEFVQFMQKHKVTQHLFPLSQWKGKTFLQLKNPYLDSQVDTDNSRYWIKL